MFVRECVGVGRDPRINLAGLTYHVWANGTSAQRILRDDIDKDTLVRLLREEVKRSNWICLAYVVMTTHYHVLLRLREATLSSETTSSWSRPLLATKDPPGVGSPPANVVQRPPASSTISCTAA